MRRADDWAIYVRPLDTPELRLLTTGQGEPPSVFWSPDSTFVAYASAGRLMKVAPSGGPALLIATLPEDRRWMGAWSTNGTILISWANGPLLRVSALGGEPTALLTADGSPLTGLVKPIFLPDGDHFLVTGESSESGEGETVYVGNLDSAELQVLPGMTSVDNYAEPGYLLFVRDGVLMAQPFDATRFALTGEAVPVADNADGFPGTVSVSASGHLAYVVGIGGDSRLVWFDRTGRELGRESLTGSLQAPNLSRDGRRLAIERTEAGQTDIWVIDLERGTSVRVTDDPAADTRPVFSPDGESIAYGRDGVVHRKSSSGTGAEQRLTEGAPTDWSSDGHIIFIRSSRLWAIPATGDSEPKELVQTRGNDRRGRVSPDGRWLAYESNFSGRWEVYVQQFPPTDARVQVSVDGGWSAYWRSDGTELYYSRYGTNDIMAVTVSPGSSFEVSAPRLVFRTPGPVSNGRFVVTPDGERFLLPLFEDPNRGAPVAVVLNWAQSLGSR